MAAKFTWIVLALVVWALAFVLIPRNRFVKLLPFGLYGGFLMALAIQLMGVPLLKLWAFRNVMAPIFGIPLFLLLAYIAEAMLFANFLPTGPVSVSIYILVFALINILVQYGVLQTGLQVYIRWNLVYTTLVAILSHVVLYSLYLLLLEPDLRQSQPARRPQPGGEGPA